MAILTQVKIDKAVKKKLQSENPRGRLKDGNGLYLDISKSGSLAWVLKIQIKGGPRREYGLGGYPVVTIAEARKEAIEYRQAARAGIDPKIQIEKQIAIPTFEEMMLQTYEEKVSLTSAKNQKNWKQDLTNYALPRFGKMKIDAITNAEVIDILNPLRQEKPDAAKKLRGALRSVFAVAEARQFIKRNPAGEAIEGGLVAMKKKKRPPFLPYDQVSGALEKIRNCDVSETARLCMEFIIFTACRMGEAAEAKWSEIDLEKRVWTIPADKQKNEGGRDMEDREVQLSDQAVKVLEQAFFLPNRNGEYVFPAARGAGAMSDTNLGLIMERIGLRQKKITTHRWRTSFKTWAKEYAKADPVISELCIGHDIREELIKTYERTMLLDEQRTLIQIWGNYLTENSPV